MGHTSKCQRGQASKRAKTKKRRQAHRRKSKTVRGQARRWFPRPLTDGQRTIATNLLQQAERAVSTSKKRWSEFQVFCEANQLATTDDFAIIAYIAQLCDDGIGLRSIRNYVRHVMAGRNGISVLSGMTKNLQRAIIKTPRRHALDIRDDESLMVILQWLKQQNPRAAIIATAMVWLGLRYGDLACVPRRYLRLLSNPLRAVVDVRESKAIKKDFLRARLVIPSTLGIDLGEHTRDLLKWYSAAEAEETVSLGLAADLNKYLRSFPSNIPDRYYTTYSFRRLAFKRFIQACTAKDGVTDWERACRFSLHLKSSTLQAFYHGELEDE